jgi:hypothetical protein
MVVGKAVKVELLLSGIVTKQVAIEKSLDEMTVGIQDSVLVELRLLCMKPQASIFFRFSPEFFNGLKNYGFTCLDNLVDLFHKAQPLFRSHDVDQAE